jgi:hypothetical protein
MSRPVLYSAATNDRPGITLAANVGRYVVRGVSIANIAALATAGPTVNGVTYAAGERILLANQTTTSQNGVYEFGTGGVGLTRVPELLAGGRMIAGVIVECGLGLATALDGSTWKLEQSVAVIGTNNAVFWPRVQKFTGALVAGSSIGTFTSAATGNVFLRSATASVVFINPVLANTPAATVRYQCLAATRVAGVGGTGAIDIMSAVAAGTINNADISTVEAAIINW